MGILKITAFQRFLSQEVINVYWYETAGDIESYDLNDVLDDFTTDVISEVKGLQSDNLEYVRFQLEDALNPLGPYYSEGSNIVGTDGSERLPSFMAWSFKANVANRTTRPGGKRFAGICQGALNDAGGIDPSAQSSIDEARTALLLPLQLSNQEGPLYPVVVSFIDANGVRQLIPQKWQLILNYSQPIISTQNSRKEGRGS